jgi:hypothetical protein
MHHGGDHPGAGARCASPLADVRALAQSIAGTLRVARGLAAAGRRIDLAGLEGPVGLLCAKTLDLPPEQGRQMRVVLTDLRRELDVLAAALRTKPSEEPPPT